MLKVVTGAEMSEIDNYTIETLGLPGAVLMENASRAVCRVFLSELAAGEKPAVTVICGSGNNGGDGFCTARILAGWGFTVFPVHVGRIQSLKDDAKLYYNLLKKIGVNIITIKEDKDFAELQNALLQSGWLIDALFGTGLSRSIMGSAAKVLKICSGFQGKVLAVDIPSGINSNSGEVLGDVLPAHVTVTFGYPKWGHFLFPGAEFRGRLVAADIGLAPDSPNKNLLKGNLISSSFVKSNLPIRRQNAHKNQCGRLAVIGGCRHYLGAAILACRAALKMGTGYVTLYLPNYLEPITKIALPDIVTTGLMDIDGGFITAQSSDYAIDYIKDKDVLAIGPGLGSHATTKDFVIDVLEENKLPAVIDADGLNSLAGCKDLYRDPKIPWIMTPHIGEAGRLLEIPSQKVLQDPLGSLEALVDKFKAIVLLKGAYTLIMNTDKQVFVNTTGNPGMAVMGMGDVLTGVVSSLLSQGVPPWEAAVSGAYIHGLAGDIASENLGQNSITASDVVEKIPEAVRQIIQDSVKEHVSFIK